MSDAPSPGATFEDVDAEGAANHADAEGAAAPDSGMLGGEGPISRLFDGSAPGPSVEELRMDYELPRPLAMIARGILRVASGDGVPPIFDIVMGSVLFIMQQQEGEGDSNGRDADADAIAEARDDVAGEGL